MFAGGAPVQDPWVSVLEDSQEQLSGISRYKKGGFSFASCFLASTLRVWPSCSEGHELPSSTSHRGRADPECEELGDAPAALGKSPPVSDYLI